MGYHIISQYNRSLSGILLFTALDVEILPRTLPRRKFPWKPNWKPEMADPIFSVLSDRPAGVATLVTFGDKLVQSFALPVPLSSGQIHEQRFLNYKNPTMDARPTWVRGCQECLFDGPAGLGRKSVPWPMATQLGANQAMSKEATWCQEGTTALGRLLDKMWK